MEQSQATALVGLIESARGRELEPSRAEYYAAEFRLLGCFACATEALLESMRRSRFVPGVSEVLEFYGLQLRDAHAEHAPLAIAAEASVRAEPLTEEQRAAFARVLRQSRERLERLHAEAEPLLRRRREREECPSCGEMVWPIKHQCLARLRNEQAALGETEGQVIGELEEVKTPR